MDVKFCFTCLVVDCILFICVCQLTSGLQSTCSKCTRFEMRKYMLCDSLLITLRQRDLTTCMRHCTDDCNGLLHNELERTCTLCASVKFETVSPEQKAIAFEKVCPLLESIRYIVYKEPQNWQEARQFCNEKHRGLAIIRNIKEYESLKTVLQEADIRSHIWIGGNLVGSKWEWVSKSGPNIEMTYTKWTPQQPSGNGNCLQFWNDYQYDDDKCDLMKSFACVL